MSTCPSAHCPHLEPHAGCDGSMSPPEAVKERTAKQVIVIRKDLGMRRGKEVAQGSHASGAWLAKRIQAAGHVYQPAFPEPGPYELIHPVGFSEPEWAWLTGRFTKIVCRVNSEEELIQLVEYAEILKVQAHIIQDAGRTEFHGVPTFTALAVGPDWADKVDAVTAGLELY